MLRGNACRKISLTMFLLTGVLLVFEQINLQYTQENFLFSELNNVIVPFDSDTTPYSHPHDDEQAELLSLLDAEDEETEEKPLRRREFT